MYMMDVVYIKICNLKLYLGSHVLCSLLAITFLSLKSPRVNCQERAFANASCHERKGVGLHHHIFQ